MMDELWSEDFSSSSDEEDDIIEEPEVWCERELEYWDIEDIMEAHRPPPVLEYIEDINTFHIREAIIAPLRSDPTEVMDPISANNWHAFWEKGRENPDAAFSFDDFNAMSEYCLIFTEAIHGYASNARLRSCILYFLEFGKFI